MKNKFKKHLKKLERKVDKLAKSKPKINHIGFDYLNNQHDQNYYDE